MALVGNMDMSMTTSVIGHLTGGSMMNTGVTDFTIKGIELPSGKLLFIMSGRYGVAKNPADVAVDVAATYKSKLTGGVLFWGKATRGFWSLLSKHLFIGVSRNNNPHLATIRTV